MNLEVSATPTLDTAAYATGDHMGSLMTFTCSGISGRPLKLSNILVIDQAKQSLAFDILFFNAAPTITSVDNAAADISDAEMLAKCVGHVSLVAGDYCILANSSVALKRDIQLWLKPESRTDKLYALLVARGAPTYAAGSLKVTLQFEA